jgi:hypothetical protein
MGLFGGEKITLTLEKYNYKPGDLIKGNIKLNLKKPLKARKMEVSFIGSRKERSRSHSYGGPGNRHGSSTQTVHVNVFNFSIPLGGEKEYQNESFDFEIKIPSDIIQQTKTQHEGKLDGALGTAVAISSALAGQRVYPIEWMIKAQLDVPMKFDVKKSQKIILSE